MKREEEIKKEAHRVSYNGDEFNSFIQGAEWADETMIGKACKWLKENMSSYVSVYVSDYYIYDDELVEDFKKAMEGE